jgi:hypothetical protein
MGQCFASLKIHNAIGTARLTNRIRIVVVGGCLENITDRARLSLKASDYNIFNREFEVKHDNHTNRKREPLKRNKPSPTYDPHLADTCSFTLFHVNPF